MATPTIADNRISYGCINVPVAFYENIIQPIYAVRKAMVFVLPDTKPVQEAFGRLQAAPKGLEASSYAPGRVPGAKGFFGDSGGLRKC